MTGISYSEKKITAGLMSLSRGLERYFLSFSNGLFTCLMEGNGSVQAAAGTRRAAAFTGSYLL